jgi:SAM-dependent methyltransferase
MQRPPADWQLPPGVTRGLWDYAHSDSLANNYDAGLEGSSLFSADIDFVRAHAGPPGWLIDLGCGTGRLLAPMIEAGWRCVGVDLSPAMLAVARRRAPSAELLRLDLVRLDALADGSFDLACCLFSTLGMVSGADHRRTAVAHAFRLLRPGGRFILHVHNYWWNLWEPAGRSWLWGDIWGGNGDRPMLTHSGVAGLALHHFTRGEAESLLRGEGFAINEVMPLGLGPGARLSAPWWFGWLRAYGYLIAAVRS